ncbi:MAG TPA: DUF6116 family protein [Candidatus Polarisedimenticolaceae bacterium]|nr:DUF6116 family protein [Candidatus Polarisedimenticolaceae bacterium]
MIDWLTRWASGLRFPTLLAVTAALFLVDLVLPDLIPFVDEVLLALLTVLFAALRRRTGRDRAAASTHDRHRP